MDGRHRLVAAAGGGGHLILHSCEVDSMAGATTNTAFRKKIGELEFFSLS